MPLVELGDGPSEQKLRPQLLMVAEPAMAADASKPQAWEAEDAWRAAQAGNTTDLRVGGKPYRSNLAHWALTRVRHNSDETAWVLYYRLATLEDVQAYARVGGGDWLPLKGLHHQGASFGGYHYPTFALRLPRDAEVDLAVRVKTRAPIRMPIVVAPSYHFFEEQRGDLVLAGVAVAVPLVVVLLLTLLMPRRAHLGMGWFIAMIALESVGAMWISGHGYVLLPQIPRSHWPVIGRVAYMLMVVISWWHARLFLGREQIPQWASWVGKGLVALVLSTGVLELFQWVNTRDAFTMALFAFTSLLTGLGLWGWRRGRSYALLYAMTWMAFLVAALVSVMGLYGRQEFAPWHVYYLQSSVAAILFGLTAVLHVRQREALLVARQQQAANLEETLALRQRFFAASHHDLQQPVHALGLHLDLACQIARAEAPVHNPERLALHLRDAQAAHVNVAHYLEGLMDMARIDAQVLQPQPKAVDLCAMLKQMASDYRLVAGLRGLQFRLIDRGAWAITDAHLVDRLLRNLLSNALRYTAQGGVLVGIRDRATHWRVDVVDTGPGLSPAVQAHMFEAFSPVPTKASDTPAGLGLGLYIVNALAEALGHRLEWRTRAGHGTRFSVYIAKQPAAQ